MVPRYNLSDTERENVEKVLAGLRNIGYMLGAREETEELTNRVVALNEFINKGDKVVEDLNKFAGETVAA
jgi:hypothetical protein